MHKKEKTKQINNNKHLGTTVVSNTEVVWHRRPNFLTLPAQKAFLLTGSRQHKSEPRRTRAAKVKELAHMQSILYLLSVPNMLLGSKAGRAHHWAARCPGDSKSLYYSFWLVSFHR